MTKERFEKLEKENPNKVTLCYALFCEQKSNIPYSYFQEMFSLWLDMFKGGDVNSAIEYYKNKFVK